MGAFRSDVLSGKVAFIAGASSGINLGVAQHFAPASTCSLSSAARILGGSVKIVVFAEARHSRSGKNTDTGCNF